MAKSLSSSLKRRRDNVRRRRERNKYIEHAILEMTEPESPPPLHLIPVAGSAKKPLAMVI